MPGRIKYCPKCGMESERLIQDEKGRYLCPKCLGMPEKPKETRREQMRKMWEMDDNVVSHRVRRKR